MKHFHASMAAAVLMAAAIAAAHAASPEGSSNLESTRAALTKWVETQEIIAHEKKDWQQGKELLTSRIEVVGKEIEMVEAQLATARGERGEADQAHSAVRSELRAIQDTTGRLNGHLVELESRARHLFESLAAVRTEKIKPLYDRMPADAAAAARVTMAERFQNVLGILGEINRLNTEITVATEIRPLSDGKPSQVKTIYLGLGQAYYVSAGGETGVGRPSEKGWVWEPTPGLATQINDVLEVIQNKASPHFVPLPVILK